MKILTTIVATIVCLAALAGWYYTAPVDGSGWLLFISFLGLLATFNGNRQSALAIVSGLIIMASSGAAWWLHRGVEHDGWVLFFCVLAAMGALSSQGSGVSISLGSKSGSSTGTSSKKSKSSKTSQTNGNSIKLKDQ